MTTIKKKAPNTIKIDGHTYNKCYISKEQWEECITPCVFCNSKVQKDCFKKNNFCHANEEHACYVDLGAIYGEDED